MATHIEEHNQNALLEYRCAFFPTKSPESASENAATTHTRAGSKNHFTALSLGIRPSPLIAFFVEAAQESISSQIAVKLSYEAIIEAAFSVVDSGNTNGSTAEHPSLEIVQEAFKAANQRVYQYAHRMLSGGKVSAHALIVSFDGRRVTIGQVGSYESILWRDGRLLRFHETSEEVKENRAGMLERFIGANAQILVDLASVRVKDTDIIVVTSLPQNDELLSVFQSTLKTMSSLDEACHRLSALLLPFVEKERAKNHEPVIFMIQVGPPTIILRNVVFEEFNS